MNASTTSSFAQYGTGSYTEVVIPVRQSEHYHIHRLIPVLADMTSSAHASDLGVQVRVAAAVKSRRHATMLFDSNPNNTTEFVVKWKGLTSEQVMQNLMPVRLHYKQQLLLLEERRMRRLIVNEEFTLRLEIGIHCRYSAPSREEILTWVPVNSTMERRDVVHEEIHRFSRVVSMLTSSQQRNTSSDFFNTPSPSSIMGCRTPWSGVFTATSTVPKRSPEPLERHPKHEGTLTDLAEEMEHGNRLYFTPKNSEELSSKIIHTVSRHLETFEEFKQRENVDLSLKKDSGGMDSLAASLMGEQWDDDDSLARSIGVGNSPYSDDSLAHSIGVDTAPHRNDSLAGSITGDTRQRFGTFTGDNKKNV